MIKIVIGLITGAGFAALAGASHWGLLVFAVAGLVSGYLADKEVGAVEAFYWGMLVLQVILLAVAMFVVALPGLLVMVPLVMVISRFVANLVGGLIARFRSA